MKEPKELQELREKAVKLLTKAGSLKRTDVLRVKIQTQHLKVQLTNDELLQAGENLTQVLDEIDGLEDEKKSFVANIVAKVKELEGRADQLRSLVQSKYERRKVDCVEVMNNTNGKVVAVRMDTKDIINERAMTADERQSKIIWPDDDDGKDEEGKVKKAC